MKKISIVVTKDYQNNKLFDLDNKTLNRDNCLYPFYLLKKELKERGHSLDTSDIMPPHMADIVLYNEMPKNLPDIKDKDKSYLLLFESELIRPDNWEKSSHQHFNKIFTWNDDLVDNKKYIKYNFANTILKTPPGLDGRNTLTTLISGNKVCSHPFELYSERKKIIDWFEKNQPLDFHYYGIGWDYPFHMRWQRLLKKLHLLSFMPKTKSICYKGKVDNKFDTLKKYRFAICYENGHSINGYITEKIFDCFFSGCIPIYWGAPNILQFVPKNTFINREDFKSHEELYQFITSLADDEILNYQKNIYAFLSGPGVYPFSAECFSSLIIKHILLN